MKEFPLEATYTDPTFHEAWREHQVFLGRLEAAQTVEDVIESVRRAAVADREGEVVVFNIPEDPESCDADDDHDETLITTTTLQETISAIHLVQQNGASHYGELMEIVKNIHIANALQRLLLIPDSE